jgi:hypothetical protein
MGQWENANCCFNKKLQILEKIAANTETQYRFIHRREMRGLKRVLRERDALIRELAAINEELSSDQTWKSMQELTPMLQAISRKEQDIMERGRQVMQEAVAERARIAAELKQSKARRQVENQYLNPWAIVARGSRINQRG